MDNEILNEVIEEFKALTMIPRKSHNEKAVSDYLVKRFEELNYDVYRDDVNNVIAEKKVNDDPFIILQGHMDMVCTYEDGLNFNPLTDHIEAVIEGNDMYAKGTTLGADDGIGVCMALVLSKHIDKNIRIICTVDEEDGMTGAIALDDKYLDGKYLINIDWEEADSICNSSAGGMNVNCTKVISNEEKISDTSNYSLLNITLKDLEGGHSGCDIDKNRTNAIRAVSLFINKLFDNNIEVNLKNIDGGFASNAIASKCIANILVSNNDEEKIIELFNEFKNNYPDKDKFNISKVDMFDNELEKDELDNIEYIKTISKKETKEIVSFISNIIDGVYTNEPNYNIVESSSNIGVIETNLNDNDQIEVVTKSLLRSCNDSKLDEIFDNYKKTAEDNGFTYDVPSHNPSWPIKEGTLAKRLMEAYKEMNNDEIKLVQVHAGLECSYFSMKNKDLEMISAGPTIIGAHTPKETLKLDTIMPIYNMLCKVINEG